MEQCPIRQGYKITQEIWEAVKAILHKYNKDTGADSKAVGIVIITRKENGNIHVSMKGDLIPEHVVASLIEAFDREGAVYVDEQVMRLAT